MVCLPELPDLSSTPGFAFHVGFLQTVKIRASDSNPFHRLSILTAACRPFSFKVIVDIVFFLFFALVTLSPPFLMLTSLDSAEHFGGTRFLSSSGADQGYAARTPRGSARLGSTECVSLPSVVKPKNRKLNCHKLGIIYIFLALLASLVILKQA